MTRPPAQAEQLSLFGEPAGRPETPAPSVPAPSSPAEPPPAASRHPAASHQVVLDGHRVDYALRRARRRSIGFVVDTDGLTVHAPKWVGQAAVDAALQAKARWICAKLAEQRERARRLQAARVEWRDGTTLPYLGRPVIVVLDPRAGTVPGGVLLDAADADGADDTDCADGNTDLDRNLDRPAAALPGMARSLLRVGLPHTASPAQIRDAVQSWLQREARRVFEARCADFAARLGVRVKRIVLSSAQTRWGSASADGTVRLNWRLVHFALPTIDYVVAHELAHLREMNHSPRFWDVVRSVLPEYEQLRGALKGDVLPVFD